MKPKKNKFVFINDTTDTTDNNIINTTNIINNQNDNEYIVLIDYNSYINKIASSYKNMSSNVVEQFNKDFIRAVYKINNKNEKNISIFIDYFEFLMVQNNFYFSEFLMLCTQAVMGCPLEILYKTIYNKNIYIGELKNNKPLVFNIYNKNNDIYFNIKKILRYFYINKMGVDITLNFVNINIYIPFSTKEKIIITYKILKNK
tara:strand:- start:188 stop:793 length:606 start_codon:yes stop_codon:yes gene_type:complete